VAKKALLKWYYSYETNTWRSNFGRPSTEDQLRFVIELKEPQLVRGCINPMSVPATWNRPVFWTNDTAKTFQFNPGVYGDYLLPGRVLIEGRIDMNPMTQWELMDEYTMEHFSARAHVYFSYPRHVRFIRITIQDWYGTTLMDDMRDDWFYPVPTTGGSHPENLWDSRADHWGEYNNIYANRTVRLGKDYTIGKCLDDVIQVPITGQWELPDFLAARREWDKWRDRTIQSMWKCPYIPPFMFFGDNGEP